MSADSLAPVTIARPAPAITEAVVARESGLVPGAGERPA
jgi:hypothetical protein